MSSKVLVICLLFCYAVCNDIAPEADIEQGDKCELYLFQEKPRCPYSKGATIYLPVDGRTMAPFNGLESFSYVSIKGEHCDLYVYEFQRCQSASLTDCDAYQFYNLKPNTIYPVPTDSNTISKEVIDVEH